MNIPKNKNKKVKNEVNKNYSFEDFGVGILVTILGGLGVLRALLC